MAGRRVSSLFPFPLWVGIAGLVLLLAGLGCSVCPFVPQPTTPTPVPPAPTVQAPTPSSVPEPTRTLQPTSTPGMTVEMAEYTNSLAGFSIQYPADWVYEISDYSVFFAEGEEELDSFDPAVSPIFVMRGGGPETTDWALEEDSSSQDLLDIVIEELYIEALDIGEIEPWDFGQVDGVGVEVGWQEEEAETPIQGYIIVALSDDVAGVGFGLAPEDEWSAYESLFRSMFASLTFFPPEIPEPVDKGPISPGEMERGTLSFGDRDRWILEAEAGQYLTIWMEAVDPDGLDTYLELYEEDGSGTDGELVVEDDDGGQGTDSLISDFKVETSGLYFIHALPYSGEGDYRLTVEVADGSSGGGEISYGETTEGRLPGGGEHEWVFTGEEGDEISVAMSAIDEGVDPYLELYSAEGEFLTHDDDSGGELNAWIEYFVLPADGTYTILVSDISGESGGYSLTLNTTQLEVEGTLTFDQAIVTTLKPGARHHWLFEGEMGDIVTLSMIAADGVWDTYLELYGLDGELVIADDDGAGGSDAAIVEYELSATGTYRVVARGYNADEGGKYELSLEMVELEIQGMLVPDQTVQAELDPGVRHHWLFEGEAGDVVSISMMAVDGEWDTFLELVGPNSEQVTVDDDSGGESNAAILDFELPLAGTYRVVARGFSLQHGGTYELTFVGP